MQSLLLWLQDNAGLNVNAVLLLLYLQTKNSFISVNNFNYLIEINKNLDSLTSNLREKRRALKANNITKSANDFRTNEYKALLHQELELEKKQQAKLISEVLKFTELYQKDANVKFCAAIDVKYYLGQLTETYGEVSSYEAERCIDDLIITQIELVNSFGLHENE